MSDCCESDGAEDRRARKRPCPLNGRACAEVPIDTIFHHVHEAWRWVPTAPHYFFCDDPSCELVYFGDDGSSIPKSQMRTLVGVKAASDEALLCYCFGIRRKDFRADPATRDFVVARTRLGLCHCETWNPSGRCCLKDFPKPGAA